MLVLNPNPWFSKRAAHMALRAEEGPDLAPEGWLVDVPVWSPANMGTTSPTVAAMTWDPWAINMLLL